MNKKYIGFYCGIVVQNNDPEKRGRVKVYVPHISATIYDNWNQLSQDRNFVFPDKTTNPDLNEILPTLKNILPWAECAAPLFGGSASGRYRTESGKGTTSDSNYFETGNFIDGNRPLQNYVSTNAYPDAFTGTNINNNRFVNPNAYQYTPSNYSNMARGLFSIPNVGSHLWLFFVDGDPNYPVYFASSYGDEDWKRIYSSAQKNNEDFKSTDYPATYENINKKDDNSQVFRGKTVFNSNKHSIELIDTDNREILKLTHYSGSFKEFNNLANIELAANNDQKMVIGDQFLTVKKNQSLYVAQSQELIVGKDQYITVGKIDRTNTDLLKTLLKEIHEYKRLFDIRRTKLGIAPNAVSQYQQQQGNYANCPVCDHIPYEPDIEGMQSDLSKLAIPLWVPDGLGVVEQVPYPDLNLGEFESLIGLYGIYKGAYCNTCNPGGTGANPGYSPSTQDGTWEQETLKNSIKTKLLNNRIAEIERLLGEGDQIITVSKNKIENVGLVMNDMVSYRVDPMGKIRINNLYVAPESTYSSFKPTPHVEYVDVDDIPGGDYNLTCTNKYKLLVGAKGISIKTFGPIDIYGTIVNFAGEQVNISSQNEVMIDGGEKLSIKARKISVLPYEHNAVVVEGQLHTTGNSIINGGAFIEGELGFLHATAPYDYHETTNQVELIGYTSSTFGEGMNPSNPPPGTHSHFLPAHTHYFKNIRVTFLPSKVATRDAMIARQINSNLIPIKPGEGITPTITLSPEFINQLANDANNLVISNQTVYGITEPGNDQTIITEAGVNRLRVEFYFNYVKNGKHVEHGLKTMTYVNVEDSQNPVVTQGPVIILLVS